MKKSYTVEAAISGGGAGKINTSIVEFRVKN